MSQADEARAIARDYLRTLWAVAATDGCISEQERLLMGRIGAQHGLEASEIETTAETSPWKAVVDEAVRMALIADVLFVVYADGVVAAQEQAIVARITADWGLDVAAVRTIDASVRQQIEWIDESIAVGNPND